MSVYISPVAEGATPGIGHEGDGDAGWVVGSGFSAKHVERK